MLRHLIAFHAYRKIHPLRQAYLEAEHDIAFEDTGRARLRDIELRLCRRVIEIRDGMPAVRPSAGARLRKIALREARRAGHKNPDLVGDAAWLEVARRAKLHGDPPCQETCRLTCIAKALPAGQAVARPSRRTHWNEDSR